MTAQDAQNVSDFICYCEIARGSLTQKDYDLAGRIQGFLNEFDAEVETDNSGPIKDLSFAELEIRSKKLFQDLAEHMDQIRSECFRAANRLN